MENKDIKHIEEFIEENRIQTHESGLYLCGKADLLNFIKEYETEQLKLVVSNSLPIYKIIGIDQPYPLKDILVKLVEASDILLHEKNYDGHGWEFISKATELAKEKITLLNNDYGSMLNEIIKFGWYTELTTKKYGSVADIYLEYKDIIGQKHFMLIDDGSIDILHTTYHIYASENLTDKIFEGRIETLEELKVVMKVLGYDKQ